MKKMISIVLSLVLMLSMSVTAFAASEINETGSYDKDLTVTATVSTTDNEAPVYSVNIEWKEDDLKFTYNQHTEKKWNADNHDYTYDTTSKSGWDHTTATVTITNHSNKDIKAAVTYTSAGDYGITGVITTNKETNVIKSGVGLTKENADKLVATLTISGTPNESVSNSTKIGTINIKIEK